MKTEPLLKEPSGLSTEAINAIVQKIYDIVKKKKEDAANKDSIVRPVYTEI